MVYSHKKENSEHIHVICANPIRHPTETVVETGLIATVYCRLNVYCDSTFTPNPNNTYK
jgi:hypothetical protein